jgi:pSer/pThr/pTyr-binding forkhead associated (FHA) protein
MSHPRVIVTLVDGDRQDERVFDEPRLCVVGRAPDCDLRVPADRTHLDVSRHHCVLDIDPPSVRVRDLCSTNGTFVNGELISPSLNCDLSNGVDARDSYERELHDGDEVQLGETTLHVHIEAEAEAPLQVTYPPVP